jgi:Arc/MetJ-type ribon-helix-helix transcriptional regulator
MSIQIAVRLPDDLVGELDELIRDGRFESRAEAVRSALLTLVERDRRRRVGEAIADGYRRVPQTRDELDAATDAAIRSIHEEPW